MRAKICLLALLLLPGAQAPPSPTAGLFEAEAKTAKAYASALERHGAWCAQKKLVAEARTALTEAFLWDGRDEKILKALEALPAGAEAPSDEKLLAELKTKRDALDAEQAKAFAKLALQAVKAKSWGAARRHAALARKLQEACPGLEGVDKALASEEAAAALKTLDAEIAQARSDHLLKPETPELAMEYCLKLPRDHEATGRCPLYIHAHGSGGSAKETAQPGSLEAFRGAGYAVLGPTCHSSWNQDKRDPGLECRQILQIVERLTVELGIDPDRVFVAGHSGGGAVAYTMLDKHRARLRGVIPIAANFYVSISKSPKPDPFPVYVIKGEKDEHNAGLLNAQIQGALDALKRGQFTNVKFEVIPEMTHSGIHRCEPQILDWCREALDFRPKK